MKRFFITVLLFFFSLHVYAPPNCEIFRNDEACYESCMEAMKAISYRQGSFQSQQHFDKSIQLCESFAYAYQEKAVPFLKRGLFIEWKKLIDKAVELEPIEYLGYRAWCRLQFLRDYEGAIEDIERLKTLVSYDIGYCQTGEYHLNIVLALCYKEIGEIEKARALFMHQINSDPSSVGLFDYYHFGVLEYESGNYNKALEYLKKQLEVNDYLGETYFFVAMNFQKLGQYEAYLMNLRKAREFYQNGKYRTDTYTETVDKIYLIDIIEALNTVAN